MKQVYGGFSLFEQLHEECNKFTDIVAQTFGPKGKAVGLRDASGKIVLTKDGATVAKFYESNTDIGYFASHALKSAALETVAKVGDGTTTSVILANSILHNCIPFIWNDYPVYKLKEELVELTETICEQLDKMSIPIRDFEDIKHVATIAANNDEELGGIIADAIEKVGKGGAISIERSNVTKSELEILDGINFASGYVAKQFATDKVLEVMTYHDPLILVTEHHVEFLNDMMNILEVVARTKRPLVIIAAGFGGEALSAFVLNAERGVMRVGPIAAPFYGEARANFLEDIAISVGAEFISIVSGIALPDIKLEHLGTASKIESFRSSTTVVGGNANYEVFDQHIANLQNEISLSDSEGTMEQLQNRISGLASSVGVIKIGGQSAMEVNEKKFRAEDALEAVAVAKAGGLICGGGISLLKAALGLKGNDSAGAKVLSKVSQAPIEYLCKHNRLSSDFIIERILERKSENFGFNFANKNFEIMDSVMEPCNVVKTALRNAVSAVSTLLMIGGVIVEKKDS